MKTKLFALLLLLICGTFQFSHNTHAQTTASDNIVRLVYFVPRHRQPQPDIDVKLDALINNVQKFFADEMERLGFDRKTFVFETDRRGNAVIHRVDGRFLDVHYHRDTDHKVEAEVSQRFDFSKNVYLIVVDVSTEYIDGACGKGGDNWNSDGDWGGRAFIPASGSCLDTDAGAALTAHELGHAFTAFHDFSNDAYIMSYGLNRTELAFCTAEWLDANRYFNARRTPPNNSKTTFRMLSSNLSPPNTIRFRFEISDPDGLQLAQLLTSATSIYEAPGEPKLLSCKKIEGRTQTVEFVTDELTAQSKSVIVRIVDGAGNYSWEFYPINMNALLPRPHNVSIPDVNLATAVREALGLRRFSNITQLDMLKLTGLSADKQEITNLSGLEHARNLKYLFLSHNQIKDIAILEEFPNLAVLSVSFNQIRDFTPIAGLTELVELDISDNPADDISPVTELTGLQTLYLNGYHIEDLTPFSKFTNLLRFGVAHNQIRDITPLAKLTQLRNLQLWDNQIRDLTPLAELIHLEWLDLAHNQISNLTPLENLTQLEVLQLATNQIDDLTPLAEFENLTHLILLSNQISDITPLSALTNLEVLVVNQNEIKNITPLARLKQLTTLWLADNQVSNFKPLTRLSNLVELKVAQNPIGDRTPLQVLLRRNSRLKLDIDPTQLSPVVLLSGAQYPPMYWTDTATSGFYRLVGGTKIVENRALGVENIIALAVDVDGSKLYWIEQTGEKHGKIVRANLNGSNVQVVKEILSVPSDIAIDTTNKKIYVTNSNGKIQRINYDGSNFRPKLITALEAPKHIVVDVAGGKFYWTEKEERIRRANLNGSDVETLVTGIGTLGDITIAGDKLYWTEQIGEAAGKIQCANLDGTGIKTLVSLRTVPLGIAVDTIARKLYWSSTSGKIKRANLNGKSVQGLVAGLGKPTDLALGTRTITASIAAAPGLISPENTALLPNYPNPFNPETWIPYQLAEPADVTLKIYSTPGELIRTLELGYKPAGIYHSHNRAVYWDGKNQLGEPVASGIYFYTLSTGDFTATRKMLIVK